MEPLDFDVSNLGSIILKKNHYYIFDEKEHDTMSNMPLDYNGSSYKRRIVFLNTMWCGLMGVPVNSRAHDLGSSYIDTIIPQFLYN
jgi:hypothetical protein